MYLLTKNDDISRFSGRNVIKLKKKKKIEMMINILNLDGLATTNLPFSPSSFRFSDFKLKIKHS